MKQATTSSEFFESKYRQSSDPWNFAESHYERARYDAVLSAIDGRRYRRAFEPGCSIGVLSQMLAQRCDQLEAIDISPTAVHLAQIRCRQQDRVRIACGCLPGDVPGGLFDLIVFSEIGYYFERKQLAQVVESLAGRLEAGGVFLAAHWLGTSGDHLLHGDDVHAVIRQTRCLSLEHEQRAPGFRLDRLVKR